MSMAKKVNKNIENPRLSPENYWEWRSVIGEMQLAEKEYKFHCLHYETMQKDIEISRLRSAIFKQNLTSYQDKKELCKKEYDRLKEKLEKLLGISLNNTSIDDITYEIHKLDEKLDKS